MNDFFASVYRYNVIPVSATPYTDIGKNHNKNEWIRIFDPYKIDPSELIWHRDKNSRTIEVLSGKGWDLQMDNSIPLELIPGNFYFVPAMVYHRLIKRKHNVLKIKIKES